MATWTRRPQETDGDYMFSGNAYVTRGVIESLDPWDILAITLDLQEFVAANDGADYLQVYTSDDGRKVWCIDQVSRSQRSAYTEEQLEEFDCWTMLLPHEY